MAVLGAPWRRRICARWIGCRVTFLAALVLLVRSAHAEPRAIAFDVPAQPLATAIERFSAATGQDFIYNSNLTQGRQSSAIRGEFTIEAALAKMLEHTGLSAQRMKNGLLALGPSAATLDEHKSGTTAQFYAEIQSGLRAVMCANQEARPGRYRLAMRLWIDTKGRLTRYEQVGSGGSREIDGAIRQAVSQLDLSVVPPADVEQPVVIVILPQAPGVTMACDAAASIPTWTAR